MASITGLMIAYYGSRSLGLQHIIMLRKQTRKKVKKHIHRKCKLFHKQLKKKVNYHYHKHIGKHIHKIMHVENNLHHVLIHYGELAVIAFL